MNDELKKLAFEAGCHLDQYGDISVFSSHTATTCVEDELEKFAKLVAAKEREACLKICEAQASTNYWEGADVCAEVIRARGEA